MASGAGKPKASGAGPSRLQPFQNRGYGIVTGQVASPGGPMRIRPSFLAEPATEAPTGWLGALTRLPLDASVARCRRGRRCR
jgi:hypothetical protein